MATGRGGVKPKNRLGLFTSAKNEQGCPAPLFEMFFRDSEVKTIKTQGGLAPLALSFRILPLPLDVALHLYSLLLTYRRSHSSSPKGRPKWPCT